MSDRIASLYVELSARTDKLEAALKTSQAGLGKFKGGLSEAVKGLTGFDVATIGTAAVLGGLAAGLKFAVGQAMEAEQAMALTESTIKATGGAAGLTATEVEAMAGKLSMMTGIADDVIQSGQNMLLTFKNIQGETFERTTRSLTDMAVAMNGGKLEGIDLKNSAIQLGKALNDPIKGISALTRVGVTFTEGQKDAIKAMVEMGDVAGAQAIILSELESEFGGAAEAAGNTAAGNFAKLKNAVSELAEELGKELLPVLSDAATAATTLINWSDGIEAALQTQAAHVTETAQTYDEYVDGILDAEIAANGLHREWYELNRELIKSGTIHPVIARDVGLMTEAQFKLRNEVSEAVRFTGLFASAQYKAAQAAQASSSRLQGLADHYLALGQGVAGANNDLEEFVDISDAVQAGISGKMAGAVSDFLSVISETNPEIEKLNAEIARMNAAHGQTFTVTTAASHSVDEYRLAQLEAATAAQKLAEFSGDSEEELLRLRIAATNAAESVAQMGTEMGISEQFTADYTKALQAANGDLGALEAQQDAAVEALRRATAEFILQQIAMELDGEAALEVARKLGLLSEQDYELALRVRESTEAWDLNKNGMIDAGVEADGLSAELKSLKDSTVNAAERAAGMADTIRTQTDPAFAEMKQAAIEARDAINSIPDRIITITTNHVTTGTPGPGQFFNQGGQAAGGPTSLFGSGPRWVGEAGPEIWVPPAPGGYILNNHDAMAAVAGGGGDDSGTSADNGELLATLRALPTAISRAVRDSLQRSMV